MSETPRNISDLPPEAQRALAEAEERRKAQKDVDLPKELGGRDGPEGCATAIGKGRVWRSTSDPCDQAQRQVRVDALALVGGEAQGLAVHLPPAGS